MKVAYIYDVIYPYVKGGAEKRFWELARRLSLKGHEVHIFGMRSWRGEAYLFKEGVHIHGIGRPKKLYLETGVRNTRQVLCFALNIFPSLLKERFDIIDCNAFPYLPFFSVKLLSCLRKTPLVITWQEIWDTYWYQYLGYVRGFMAWLIERLVIKLSGPSIAHSLKTKGELVKLGMKEERIKIIPHGIDFNLIKGTLKNKENSDLIFVGRLIKEKNVDILIRSLSLMKGKLNTVKCTIVGEGPERQALINLVNKLGLTDNVVFKGFIEYGQIISLMKSAKLFIFPSIREGFGIVVIEAMACGLPVITVRHNMNAACELIHDGQNGFICEADAEDISKRILYLLNDEAIRKDFSEAAQDSIKDYDWDIVADDNEEFYRRVIYKN